jgi:hypothetical protein
LITDATRQNCRTPKGGYRLGARQKVTNPLILNKENILSWGKLSEYRTAFRRAISPADVLFHPLLVENPILLFYF